MTGPASVFETCTAFLATVITELRWRLAAAIAVAVALAFAEGGGLLLLIPLLSSIGLAVDQGSTGDLAATIEWAFAAAGIRPTLPTVLAVFLLVTVAHAFFYRAHLLLNPSLEQRFAVVLRRRLYAAIVRATWSFYITRRSTDMVHAVTAQVDRASATVYQLLTLLTGVAVTLVYVTIAFKLSASLTALALLAGLGVLWTTRRRTQGSSQTGERYSQADRQQFHIASESIAGLKTAKTLGAEERDVEIFVDAARARAEAYLEMLRAFARAKFGLDIISALLLSALLLIAVQGLGLRGTGLLLMIFVFARIMPRVMSLQQSVQIMVAGLPAFQSVRELVEQCEAHPDHLGGPASSRCSFRREIRFEDVSYAYGDGPSVLRNVSMSIPAGRFTAIVGPSGAGKSTLADLLIGLLRPTGGRMTIDDHPLTDDEIAAWRHSVGYLPQESFLLHDTVRANLLWAKPHATEAEMWEVLELAAAAGFLRARPEGLDSVVGDRGLRLSGGERQRLSIARALLTRPRLLVLDEATSALDSVNEQQVLAVVQGLAERLTTVIITHRLSAIRGADVIHVLEGGRLAETGTWHELGVRGGAFAALLNAQGLDWTGVADTLDSGLPRSRAPISGRATATHGQ